MSKYEINVWELEYNKKFALPFGSIFFAFLAIPLAIIMDFGAFVEILPGKEGLCHISKFSRKKIASVSDVVKEGQQIPVKLIEIDKMGRLNLSYIDAIEAQAK